MEGIVYSNLKEIVKNKEAISTDIQTEKWGLMPYEAGRVKGECLVAAEQAQAEDLVFAPKLKGWHKIYIATTRLFDGYSFDIKMDTDRFFMPTCNTSFAPPFNWTEMENVEEMFYRCADMTDREIIIRKTGGITMFFWLRFVPMSEAEVEEYKAYMNPEGHRNLHLHFDGDTNLWYGSETEDILLIRAQMLQGADAKLVTYEQIEDIVDYDLPKEQFRRLRYFTNKYSDENEKVAAKIQDVAKLRIDYIHALGIPVYVGIRVSQGDTEKTILGSGSYMRNVQEHPEWHMKTRDGRDLDILSYAYEGVHEWMIGYAKKKIDLGFDGISMIMSRGMMIAFEQPVLDEFAKRHDGLDARLVPMDDKRLKDVWCDFMTAFFRRFRKELNEYAGRYVPINLITGDSPEISRRVGLDVEVLCREGLIDHVCQDTMDTYEVLDGCLGEDGLIDMEKYKEKLYDTQIVRRAYCENWESTKAGAPLFVEICEKYGVDFFGQRPYYGGPVTQLNWIKKMRELGVKNFNFINYCHNVQDLPKWYALSKLGHEVNLEYCKVNTYRMMMLDGVDLSTYMPHWRG